MITVAADWPRPLQLPQWMILLPVGVLALIGTIRTRRPSPGPGRSYRTRVDRPSAMADRTSKWQFPLCPWAAPTFRSSCSRRCVATVCHPKHSPSSPPRSSCPCRMSWQPLRCTASSRGCDPRGDQGRRRAASPGKASRRLSASITALPPGFEGPSAHALPERPLPPPACQRAGWRRSRGHGAPQRRRSGVVARVSAELMCPFFDSVLRLWAAPCPRSEVACLGHVAHGVAQAGGESRHGGSQRRHHNHALRR